jgi:hypothetical protein
MRGPVVSLPRPARVAAAAVWCLGLTTLGLVAWGVLRATPAPTRPWAPLALGGGAGLVLGCGRAIPSAWRCGCSRRCWDW